MAVALNPRPYKGGETLPAALGGAWRDPFAPDDRSRDLVRNPRFMLTEDDREILDLWFECVRFSPMSGLPDGFAIYLEDGGLLAQNAWYMAAFQECSRAWTTLKAKKP